MKGCGLRTPDTQHKIGVLIGIPAYDEGKYIAGIVLQAKQYADEVIVVDDGSSDDTARIAELAGATVVRHDRKRGKGVAIESILAEARKRNPDVLVLLDADSQHNPNEIPVIIEPVRQGFDLVIGSREAQKENTPAYRRVGQRVLSRFARILSSRSIYDSESGFRALSPRAINEIELKEKGFAIETEMIASAADKNLRITEVPISNIYTTDGSTLNPVRHGAGVLNRIVVMISERRPLFFFGLAGGILLVAALITAIRVLNIHSTKHAWAYGSIILTALFVQIGTLSIFTGIILNSLRRRK
jgi:glycosyltransferase involved in cell wall biosynthesis